MLSELVAPDSIWDMRSWPSWSGQPQFHGRDGFMEFFAEWTGAYEGGARRSRTSSTRATTKSLR